jgi:DNA-binding transcriptional MerR regulator
MPTKALKKPVSAEQVALHYGVNIKTVRRWQAMGLLTPYRVGRHLIRFEMDEVEQLAKPVA